ncbi:MAG: ArsR family transcriptional regulator [Clostridiales bacterium]|nr:ArsR family transcriptional regulator [Clostridiales bacterium]
MGDLINSNKNFVFNISETDKQEEFSRICKAISSLERIKILHLICQKPMTIAEIAEKLDLPLSTTASHCSLLQETQLIFIDYKPSIKGQIKLCCKSLSSVTINFYNEIHLDAKKFTKIEMPVGYYSECKIETPCGLASLTGAIGSYDNSSSFYLPERVNAEILWFQNGIITYIFPNTSLADTAFEDIAFSFELCSEAVYYRNDWPSDITIWINDIEIATYTSPGDFGGRRGRYTPDFWYINSTQFGILKKFSVNEHGCCVDDILHSKDVTIADLNLQKNEPIKLSIGIKKDATHKGGINIFGKNWGDSNQSIIMTLKNKDE